MSNYLLLVVFVTKVTWQLWPSTGSRPRAGAKVCNQATLCSAQAPCSLAAAHLNAKPNSRATTSGSNGQAPTRCRGRAMPSNAQDCGIETTGHCRVLPVWGKKKGVIGVWG
ncbi:unnamed protein product [Polarella glacialis]|uniref:Secreted protein n=1 Tax=Polarella glacialis TaxID=89957 RepID=A0A813DJY1_POLGL|nr:unnamed protein product [Polarella glacialis]